jgi:hypothetical protein
MIWVLRLFGYPVLTFGPELLGDEPEDGLHISNTGGRFELAEAESDEDDWEYEEDSGFGFRS